MKSKKALAIILAVNIILTSFLGTQFVKVQAESRNVSIEDTQNDILIKPSETVSVKKSLKSLDYLTNAKITSITFEDSNAALSVQNAILKKGNSEITSIDRTGTSLEFDISAKDYAKIGRYKIKVELSYSKYVLETGYENQSETLELFARVTEEKSPAQLTVNSDSSIEATIGKDIILSFNLRNDGELTAKNIYVSLDYSDEDTKNSFKNVNKRIKVGDLAGNKETKVNIPVSVLKNAKTGAKVIKVNIEYKDSNGEVLKGASDLYLNLLASENSPKLELYSVTYNGKLKAGDSVTLVATLVNNGYDAAKNIKVSIDESSLGINGFIKNYFTDTIAVADIKEDKSRDVKIPLIIPKEATGGLKELKLKVAYQDADGVEHVLQSTIYPEVAGKTENEAPQMNLFINQVRQSPSTPNAGGQVNISFVIQNKGKQTIKDIKIISSFGEGTFLPVNSEPYVFIEKLNVGEKRNITIPLMISKDIKEGLNQITVKTEYSDDFGKLYTSEGIAIPVLDVVNDDGEGMSKPKLIISKFDTDIDELRAGSSFKFNFQLRNTNTSVAAKNITITVSQKDNIFTVTQGSNSIFIDKIAPGEVVDCELEMKIKSDASTGAYPLNMKFDYEYEGAPINPVTGEVGESKTEELNLMVIENSRPVVDSVNVYSMMGNVIVNENATLSFEFFNMGKSTLNNVIATIEGDFIKADGNMSFIGNIEAGRSEFIEFDVIPSIEGLAKGVLKITFEDSNGEEVSITKEFESNVMGEQPMFPGGPDPFEPMLPEPKKPILKVWQFSLVLIAIVVSIPFITKAIIIAFYKKKLMKEEQ